MGTIRNTLVALALAASLTAGGSLTAVAEAPAAAASAPQSFSQSQTLEKAQGHTPLSTPRKNAITNFSLFPYPAGTVLFTRGETSAIVQAGIVGSATYAAAKTSNPYLKAAFAVAGALLWSRAKSALESSPNGCLFAYWTSFTGLSARSATCRTGGGVAGGFVVPPALA